MNLGRRSENTFSDEKKAGRGSQVCPPVGSISRIDRKKLRADLTPLLVSIIRIAVKLFNYKWTSPIHKQVFLSSYLIT